jgi:hypothetical protein
MKKNSTFFANYKKSVTTMEPCNHSTLVLLIEKKNRLRCKRCHLTIKDDDLENRYCPECYEDHGIKQYDFEKIDADSPQTIYYRCEKCNITIACK